MEEDALVDVIHYLSLNPHLKLTKVAKEKSVKYHKLRARKLSQPFSHTHSGQNKKLTLKNLIVVKRNGVFIMMTSLILMKVVSRLV
jgi:hypothetical protein